MTSEPTKNAAKVSDRQMLAMIAQQLLGSYSHERGCDHYRIGETIVDHFGLEFYDSERGFFDDEGRTLLRIAQGFGEADRG